MPELPEVETVCRALRPHLLGRRILGIDVLTPRLRNTLSSATLNQALVGRVIRDVRRRAKFIIVELDTPTALVLHLGMTGAPAICATAAPAGKHLRARLHFDNGTCLHFNDSRKFGLLATYPLPAPGAEPLPLCKLGVEPLSDAFSPAYLYACSQRLKRPIKPLLMDQAVVAGVGNIYASEACFRAGIRPQRRSQRLTRRDCARLAAEVKAVLQEAILCGGTTIANFHAPDGQEGAFHIALQVYGRAGAACTRCGERWHVRRLIQAGRSTYYCPGCQK